MRLNMTQQGGLVDEYVSGGGSVLNPLILAGNPTLPLEAATKQYVDNGLMSLNANNLINGTIAGNRFPAMNGDLISSPGSVNLLLSNTGVTPGTYPKVSVNNKGRVTNGLTLIQSDIPELSWNKITTDKATTLDGYGITDALQVNGGTLTGPLSVTGTPTLSNQLINKSYLDSVVGGTTGIAVGDIITKIDSTTPVGFLKCNGAELDKTAYPDLYTVIGDRYVLNGKAGNGQPWRNQYEINTENYTDLNNWRAINSLPGVLGGSVTFVTKNRLYVFGGFNGTSHVGTGYTAAINNDGTLGPWSAATALPGTYAYSASIVTKNKVYLLGGYINNTTATNNIYVADINADGTIGVWSNGPAMPGVTSYNTAFVNKNKVYVVGGYNGSTGLSSIFSNEIKEDGSLGAWSIEAPLPVSVHVSPVTVIKNRVYIIGGQHNNAYSANIYSAALNSDGSIGTWQFSGVTPVTLGYHQIVVTRNNVYIVGGVHNGAHSANIYKATVLADGTLSSWTVQPWALPATLANSNITITKDHIHVVGGMVAGGWSGICWTGDIVGGLNDYSSFYSNEIEQNYMVAGSGKPWQQQYQINITQSSDITGWVTDTSVLPVNNKLSMVAVTKNRVYLCGGHNGTTALNSVYSSSVNSDGTLDTWVAETNLPAINFCAQVLVISNRIYILGGRTDSSSYSNIYTALINSDGTLGTWTLSGSLPGPLSHSHAIITRNRVYLLGGFNGTNWISTVYTAIINVDGTLGTWTTGTSLPVLLDNSQAIVTKNRVYLLGGQSDNTIILSTVYTAPINSDGTLGAWSSTTSLPGPLSASQSIVTKNRVYLLGGYNGVTYSSVVYTATINSDGIIGTWTTGTSLPGILGASSSIIVNNKVYLLGGSNSTNPINTIYSAPILEGLNDYSSYYAEDTNNYIYPGSGRPWQHQYQINETQSADITGWTAGTAFPIPVGAGSLFVTKNRVYHCGGYTSGGAITSAVYSAVINGDGTLGTWTLGTALPAALTGAQAIVYKNKVYITGGISSSAVYIATINSDGTIGTWTITTPLPVWVTSHVCFITNKKVYILGGSTAGGYSAASYYANINNDGSLGGWITGTSLPWVAGNLQVIITKNTIYALTGFNGSSYNGTAKASIDPNGIIGNWSTSTNLPGNISHSQVLCTKNKAYIFAGYSTSVGISAVFTAPINADGTLGTWTAGTSIPISMNSHSMFMISNKIYSIGGRTNGEHTWYANVYTASITGGLNDYSPYYNGDILPIEQFVTASKFKLPDSSFSNDNLNYFIKY